MTLRIKTRFGKVVEVTECGRRRNTKHTAKKLARKYNRWLYKLHPVSYWISEVSNDDQ